jgi:Peptidase family C25
VPYYLVLVGPPTQIPFEFQYLLGIEYAVGRLAFDSASDYALYARSVIAYETASAVKNSKDIVFWGTSHPADPATALSERELIEPLANGIDDRDAPRLKTPVNALVGYGRKLFSTGDATKGNLLATLTSGMPPALLFTASHGLWPKAGAANQLALQGALLCQDWPGFGSMQPEHFLSAADVPDDATVGGMIAFFFACFGAGTPNLDQFRKDPNDASTAVKLAEQPFVAALPRRLLAHPNGGALAVIGHVDRAWSFSIRPPKATGPQIRTFINTLAFTLGGAPAGFAVQQNFGGHFSALSVDLLDWLSPTAPAATRPTDRELVNAWTQRNDAQNYVILGDPAVRIRSDALGG